MALVSVALVNPRLTQQGAVSLVSQPPAQHGCTINTHTLIFRSGTHSVRGNKRVKIFGNAVVHIYDRVKAEAHDDSVVFARGHSSVKLFNRAHGYIDEHAKASAFHQSHLSAGSYTTAKFYHRSRGDLYGGARAKAFHRSRLNLFGWSEAECIDRACVGHDLRSIGPELEWWEELPLPPRMPRGGSLSKSHQRRMLKKIALWRRFPWSR